MRTADIIAAALMVSAVAEATAQSAVGWPDAVAQLAQERSQAQACVDLLKATGDKTSILNGRIAYGGAKAAADGVIAGLTVALVQGGNPAELPKMTANLERAGAGLQEVCDDAIKAAKASEGRAWSTKPSRRQSARWSMRSRQPPARYGGATSRWKTSKSTRSKASSRPPNGPTSGRDRPEPAGAARPRPPVPSSPTLLRNGEGRAPRRSRSVPRRLPWSRASR